MSALPFRKIIHWTLMLLTSLLCAILCLEFALRHSCFTRTISDLHRIQFAWTEAWDGHWVVRQGAAFPLPGLRLSMNRCGIRLRFDTLPCPVPDLGYRGNGIGDDPQPVFGLVLGDSFAEGAQVDDEETYVSRLSQMTGKRFVNLGVAAQGTTGHWTRLRISGFLELKPKIVVLQLHAPQDAQEDAWREIAALARRRNQPIYFSPYASFFGRLPSPFHRWITFFHRNSILFFLLEKRLASPALLHDGLISKDAILRFGTRLQRRNLDGICRTLQAFKSKLLIAEIGVDARKDYGWTPAPACKAVFLPIRLQAHQILSYDNHPNQEGQREIARQIQRRLIDHHWL